MRHVVSLQQILGMGDELTMKLWMKNETIDVGGILSGWSHTHLVVGCGGSVVRAPGCQTVGPRFRYTCCHFEI